MKLPDFDSLLKQYPRGGVVDVKKLIGGAVDDTQQPQDKQWLGGINGDTCTIRMSRALNYSGVHLTSQVPRLADRAWSGSSALRLCGAGDSLVAYRHVWSSKRRRAWQTGVEAAFLTSKGIILFDIKFGLNDDLRTRALGHVDLWDSKTFFDELTKVSSPSRDFFQIADRVSLWIAQGSSFWPPNL